LIVGNIEIANKALTSFTPQRAITGLYTNPDAVTQKTAVELRNEINIGSPCGQAGTINVNFRAAIESGTDASFTGSENDSPVFEEFGFKWMPC
jgi:hypothetical protein